MIVLRPYQEEWIAGLRAAMRRTRRVLGVMPTGAGKTVCFAYITAGALAKGKRVLILVHRALILDQISAALDAFDVPHGRIQPGWPPTTHAVQIGMVQTVARRADRLPEPDLIVPDEAHHVVSPTYIALLRRWAHARSLGVTATPERLDGRGLGEHFEEMVRGPEIPWLIDNGFLADYDYFAPGKPPDVTGVRTVRGDYEPQALSDAIRRQVATGDIVQHYRELGRGRPAVAFCISVKDAEYYADAFHHAGYRAASIDGTMSEPERRARLHGLADGSLNVLTSCDLIGEGIDVPAVAVIIHLRLTQSLALKKQMDGRGLRLKPDGGKAVIIDHMGNSFLHGTPRTVHSWSLDSKRRKKTEQSVHIRQCGACFRVFERAEPIDCDSDEPECLAQEREVAPRQIEQVEGRLVQITDSPEWAGGASLTLAKGDEWRAMVSRATTADQLRQIAKARGYHPLWVRRVLASRGQRVSQSA